MESDQAGTSTQPMLFLRLEQVALRKLHRNDVIG
jgi:hypothetical protein